MNPQKAAVFQKEWKKKLQKDTYKERRKEGRTQHGQTSMASISLGILGWFLNLIALGVPAWRTSFVALFGYASRRGWGLFGVQGREFKAHYEIAEDTCRYFGELKVGNGCFSPICKWYMLKCNTYIEMAIVSYSVGLAMVIVMLIQTCCVVWTIMMSPRLLRWASIWFIVIVLVELACLLVWWLYTETLFENLDVESVYPTPPPGVAFICAATALCFLAINSVLGCTLRTMWPEVDIDGEEWDSSSEDEDEDEDDEDEVDREKKKKAAKPMPHPQAGTPLIPTVGVAVPFPQEVPEGTTSGPSGRLSQMTLASGMPNLPPASR
jgi:hypothetical protein